MFDIRDPEVGVFTPSGLTFVLSRQVSPSLSRGHKPGRI
jgi:hypothetical protein